MVNVTMQRNSIMRRRQQALRDRRAIRIDRAFVCYCEETGKMLVQWLQISRYRGRRGRVQRVQNLAEYLQTFGILAAFQMLVKVIAARIFKQHGCAIEAV
ncbi:hypothetical protein D9M69_685580 [compost metagenome]